MRIFVSGASGFLGSHLVPLLNKAGHQVLLLSRTTEDKEHVKGDLNDPGSWQYKVRAFRPDAAIHLAWEGVATYNATTSEVAFRNLDNSLRLTNFLGKIGCKRFVALGSVTDYSPANLTPFSVSKTAFRVLGEAAARQYAMPFFWASPFYIYGPGQRKEALLPYAINSLLKGVIPDIKNPGLRQDFIYVGDVARALLLIAEKGTEGTIWYEIGSGKSAFVGNLLNIVNKKLGNKETYSEPADAGELPAALIANTEAMSKLGWAPEITLKVGVGKTVDYYKNKLS